MREFFTPFKHQSRLAHLGLVIAGGLAFVAGVYGTVFLLYDGTTTFAATGSDAVAARRTAFMVGATVCWFVFAVGFLRTIGGPGLNVAWYPLTILALGTGFAYPLLFGPRPDAVYTEGFLYSPGFIRDTVTLFLPGVVLFMLVFLLAMAMGPDTEEAQKAWMERHLSESILERHHPDFEDGQWTDSERD